MWQEQTTRGSANVLERPPKAALDEIQLAFDVRFCRPVMFVGSRQSRHMVETQQRETDLLCGPIVELGAEAAEESLIECGCASRCPTHPLVKLLILLHHLGQA